MGLSAMSFGAVDQEAMAAENNQAVPVEQVVTGANVRKVVGYYIA